MKIYLCLFFLVLPFVISAVEPEPVGMIRSSLVKMAEFLKAEESYLFNDLYRQSGDTSNDLIYLTSNNLVKIYYFDKNKIMEKELSFETINIPYQTVHRNMLELDRTTGDKVFLSDFFLFKNKTYFMAGRKYQNRMVLVLMALYFPEVEGKYAVLDYQGDVMYNTLGIPLDLKGYISRMKKSEEIEVTSGRLNIYRFKFLKNYSIYHFVTLK